MEEKKQAAMRLLKILARAVSVSLSVCLSVCLALGRSVRCELSYQPVCMQDAWSRVYMYAQVQVKAQETERIVDVADALHYEEAFVCACMMECVRHDDRLCSSRQCQACPHMAIRP